MAMIGLPVMIICGGAAVLGTSDVSVPESLPVAVGDAQALITTHSGVVEQTVGGDLISESEQPAPSPVAGRAAGDPWTSAQLAQLTGGQVGVSGMAGASISAAGESQSATVRVIGREVLSASGLIDLVEGRLPAAPGEVLVTESGLASGLPRSGTVELATSEQTAPARIVGVAKAVGSDFQPVSLVVGAEWLDAEVGASFVVVRDHPVAWTDVEAWNAAGLTVLSPTVLADPPAGVPTEVDTGIGNAGLVILLSMGLVLETALLAGPAFAVSAARRRRSLALIATNGADRGQILRFVTVQGVLLGGLAVLLGAALGTIAGWLFVRGFAAIFDARRVSTIGRPPLDTYGWVVALIVVVAFLAAVISAALPGLRLTGRGIVGDLTARVEHTHPRRSLPIAGGITMAAGALLATLAMIFSGSMTSLVAAGTGGALLIIGGLFLIPLLLAGLEDRAAAVPAALRMGMREVTRSRARSVPAVAAITVVVGVLTMITISALSDDAQARRDYLPSTLPGAAVVDAYGSYRATLAEITRKQPTWSVQPAGSVGTQGKGEDGVRVSGIPQGCDSTQVVAPWDPNEGPTSCQLFSSEGGWTVAVPAANTLNPAAALSTEQRRAFDDGALLVTSPDLINDGTAQLAVVAYGADPSGPGQLQRTARVSAVLITPAQYQALGYQGGVMTSSSSDGAVISATGAEAAGLPWTAERYEIVDPAGPIDRTAERAINDRVAVPLEVERGYTSTRWILITLLCVTVALALVGSLVSTALTQVEARPEAATLAAVGATPGFRRQKAAGQAVMIAATGSVLGVMLGIVPGLALAATITTDWDPAGLPPVFVVPYAELVLLVVVVPLMAAGLAALMVPRHPVLTRRPT